jgi:hypothetical protein
MLLSWRAVGVEPGAEDLSELQGKVPYPIDLNRPNTIETAFSEAIRHFPSETRVPEFVQITDCYNKLRAKVENERPGSAVASWSKDKSKDKLKK